MLAENIKKYADELITRYPVLAGSFEDILKAYEILEQSYTNGGKLLIAGNGGSCSDANHIVGELMKGFCSKRPLSEEMKQKLIEINPEQGVDLSERLQEALPTIALDNHNALNTAFLNDVDGYMTYAQQVNGYAENGDVFLGISTSGNSKNILYAAITAKAKGAKVIGLTGRTGGKLLELADVCIRVDETETVSYTHLTLPTNSRV
mgnify:FL=1